MSCNMNNELPESFLTFPKGEYTKKYKVLHKPWQNCKFVK